MTNSELFLLNEKWKRNSYKAVVILLTVVVSFWVIVG